MPIKMSELVRQTDTPKSTILYYIKEGLLPQPHKPKPNLHLYDEEMVERINFIAYLQKQFDASITEIKTIMESQAFSFDQGFEGIWRALDILMGASHLKTYTEAEACKKCDISLEKLNEYLHRELLFLRDGLFTDKEIEMIEILQTLEKLSLGQEILDAYVHSAKALAAKEVTTAHTLLDDLQPNRENETIKTLFDTTLILKPYLFNMQTLTAYQKSDKKTLPKKDHL
ncbi:MAG: MerR family transcriptional regulator [Campylobacterota bacterium]|nr:MerR family transcriptional regulator [Campylobacterota bacterium]